MEKSHFSLLEDFYNYPKISAVLVEKYFMEEFIIFSDSWWFLKSKLPAKIQNKTKFLTFLSRNLYWDYWE
jgi:hypothetical protein